MGIPTINPPSSEMWMRAAGVGVPSAWDIFGDAVKNAAQSFVEVKKYKEQQEMQQKKFEEDQRQFNEQMRIKNREQVLQQRNVEEQRKSTESYREQMGMFKGLNLLNQQQRQLDAKEAQKAKELARMSEKAQSEAEQRRAEFARNVVSILKQNPDQSSELLKQYTQKNPWLSKYIPNEIPNNPPKTTQKENYRLPGERENWAEKEATYNFQKSKEGQTYAGSNFKSDPTYQRYLQDARSKQYSEMKGKRSTAQPGELIKSKVPVNDESGAIGRNQLQGLQQILQKLTPEQRQLYDYNSKLYPGREMEILKKLGVI